MKIPRFLLLSSIATLLAAPVPVASAALVTYTVDANTLQLWHLDEAAGASETAAFGSYSGNAFTVDANPAVALPPLVTTVLGASGFAGFGQAANFTGNTDFLLGFDTNLSLAYDGDVVGIPSADVVTLSNLGIGGTNPFTLEAMINLSSAAGNREIIATDSSGATRGFQFRVTTGGTTGQQLEFNLIGSAGARRFADIPVSGDHAFSVNNWFHTAFTFDGTNAQFYWTKVDPNVPLANPIGTAQALTISGTAGSILGPLTFGNEQRNVAAEGLNGLLDEIRISDIARGPAQFIFTTSGGSFWNNAGSGNWDTGTNWTAGVPNFTSAIASLGGGGTELTGPATITLNGTKTAGAVTFDNATNSFTLASGTAGALALDNGAATANITVLAGVHAITVPMAIPAAGATITVANAVDKLVIGSAITGSGPFTKGGAGTLEFADGGSLPATDPIISAGILAFNRSTATSIASNFSGSGAVAQNGSGSLTLTGVNSHSGGNIVNAGTFIVGSATALGATTGPLTVNGGLFDANGQSPTVGALSGTGGIITDNSATPGTTTLTVTGSVPTEFAGLIANGATRTLALVRNSAATPQNALALTQANTYSGGTTITRGFLTAGNNSALGTGPVTMTAATGGGNEARLQLTDGVTLANNITVDSFNGGVGVGVLGIAADNSSATFSGTITFNADGISGGNISGPATAGLLTFTGPINLGGTATFLNIRNGLVRLNGGGNYNAITIAGTTSIGVSNALPISTVMTLSTAGPGTFDLNGFDQTLDGLVKTNAAAGSVINFGATTSTLTLAPTAPRSFNGSISGDLIVNVTGPSSQTFAGPLSFSTLNATGGQTILNASLVGATINANGGRLDLNADAAFSNLTVSAGSTAYITVDQSLAELNIGATGVVVVTNTPPPALAPEFFLQTENPEVVAVPEPASFSLLLIGAIGLLRRPRR